MLITPRTYQLAQQDRTDRWNHSSDSIHLSAKFHSLTGWHADKAEAERAYKMLLVHQSGYVRVGEVVRYTLTYTPDIDQILPTPSELHVKVKNTSAIPLRAAYLHGPYTLYTACYPENFDANHQSHDGDGDDNFKGIPQYEPYLKAGGSWTATIPVPEEVRLVVPSRNDNFARSDIGRRSITWVIEITSQVIFSSSAVVHYELLVGRDRKSLEFGINGSLSSSGMPPPAHMYDHQSLRKGNIDVPVIATKGVFSKSVNLVFNDTKSLWNTPDCPFLKEREQNNSELLRKAPAQTSGNGNNTSDPVGNNTTKQKRKRVHLVILTHGLHSNLGADMLYLKESIDSAAAAAKNAKQGSENGLNGIGFESRSPNDEDTNTEASAEEEGEEEDEEVIVRGFPGNVTRTERGIQYLGKRLAKYVLLLTYPDQPYLPIKKKKQKKNANASPDISADPDPLFGEESEYQVTSISFVGHSLGGLIQTYAIAYIQKHSPEFFERINPINFVALATPFLGLSNENPVYVRFALDLGLVGKTGQDLGLSWTSPRVRSRWDAVISKFAGSSKSAREQSAPASKPLLRILPAGPAHQVLQKFRNRTVYSNVVNDGIVPLRTSCLLFLDWRGLDRVQKARRGNGLVGTMAEWGWAELTGANSPSPNQGHFPSSTSGAPKTHMLDRTSMPKLDDEATLATSPTEGQFLGNTVHEEPESISPVMSRSLSRENSSSPNPFNHFFTMFQSKQPKHSRSSSSSKKSTKILQRSQTLAQSSDSTEMFDPINPHQQQQIVRGSSLYDEQDLSVPPRTTIFESAGDVLRPPLPPTEFLIDPASRPRTIFHDRIYHPDDIPPPVLKKRGTIFTGSKSSHNNNISDAENLEQAAARGFSGSGLRVEEKIARAYHQDLSWRKVLVRLEPDAHNNIIVRRMFANAYGWPVVKHLVDNHFGDSYSARTDDALESNMERAKPLDFRVTDSGEEIIDQADISASSGHQQKQLPLRPVSDLSPNVDQQGKADDDTTSKRNSRSPDRQSVRSTVSKADSAQWTDRYFSGGDSASDAQSDHEDDREEE